MSERISADGWEQHEGHVARYRFAASHVRPGEIVNDIACGVGYAATLFPMGSYRGYDRSGAPDPRFPGSFHTADLNDLQWRPDVADVTACFETLEHVKDPAHLARVICETTRRAIVVSVPVVPTMHVNPYHLHDFERQDIPPMFHGFRIVDEWPQPQELAHVWLFERSTHG